MNSILGIIGSIIGVYSTMTTITKNRDKEIKDKASNQAMINAKLDVITGGVESLRTDMRVAQQERVQLSERITVLEEANRQIHKRIDKVERRQEVK